MAAGEHMRRGYKMVTPSATALKAVSASLATVEKTHKAHAANFEAKGLRDGSSRSRRQWEHRKIAEAKPGQIVHHIDGDPLNNARDVPLPRTRAQKPATRMRFSRIARAYTGPNARRSRWGVAAIKAAPRSRRCWMGWRVRAKFFASRTGEGLGG